MINSSMFNIGLAWLEVLYEIEGTVCVVVVESTVIFILDNMVVVVEVVAK